jgi:hypothetical protein
MHEQALCRVQVHFHLAGRLYQPEQKTTNSWLLIVRVTVSLLKSEEKDNRNCVLTIKGIVQPFELGGETKLIRSKVFIFLFLRYIFQIIIPDQIK